MERRFRGGYRLEATGVPLPGYGGNGTPVRGRADERGRWAGGAEGRIRMVGQGGRGGPPPALPVAHSGDAGRTVGPAGVVEAAPVFAGAGSGLCAVPDADGLRLGGQPEPGGPGRLSELVPGV